jgi:hypothetical protein
LFDLINQKDGLCQAFCVSQAEVFYFHEFRDEEKSTEWRRRSWNGLVLAHSCGAVGESDDLSKQRVEGGVQENPETSIEPSQSFANETTIPTSSFDTTHESRVIKELDTLLGLANEDIGQMPLLATDGNMRQFLSREVNMEMFGREGAQGIVAEVRKLWPELEITSDNIFGLKRGLDGSGIALQYRHLRGLLAHGSSQLDQTADPDNQRLNQFVRNIRDTVALIVGDTDIPRVSTDRDKVAAVLASITNKVKEIRTTWNGRLEEPRPVLGDQIGDQSLRENAMDVDSA